MSSLKGWIHEQKHAKEGEQQNNQEELFHLSDLNIQTNLLIVVFFILEVLICVWKIIPSLICTFHSSVFTHQSASLSSSNFTFLFKVLLFADPQKGM